MTPRPTALITGAAQGIGLATATRLARDGYRVVAVDANAEALNLAAQVLPEDTLIAVADVTSSRDWADIVAVTLRECGRLDVLVNNAGIAGPISPIDTYPEEDFRRVLDVNVVGAFLGLQACGKLLRVAGGSVVNVASVSGLGGQPRLSGYVASKHALVGLTKVAALELAADGVRVNAVCPSPVDTAMVQLLADTLSPDNPDEVHERMKSDAILNRYATADEVADAIAYLVSPGAEYLNGVLLPVDGGSRAR